MITRECDEILRQLRVSARPKNEYSRAGGVSFDGHAVGCSVFGILMKTFVAQEL